MANTTKILTPHAAALIFNYEDRLGSEVTTTGEVDLLASSNIISTKSLVSIRTSKSKGQPAGTFEITLAPTRNWVSTLTAGSWICLLMGRRALTKQDFQTAQPDTLKMVGRIDSVRAIVNVNQTSGAVETSYVVSGQDWGQVFNNILYVDPLIDPGLGPLSAAVALNLNNVITDSNGNLTVKSSSQLIQTLLYFWGLPLNTTLSEAIVTAQLNNITLNGGVAFTLPQRMAAYFNYFPASTSNSNNSQNITDAIELVAGTLTAQDSYTDVNDAVGFLNPSDLYSMSTVWQIMMEHSNPTINEMYCDLRFDELGPSLALYNRVKPFIVKSSNLLSNGQYIPVSDYGVIQKLISPYINVQQTVIPMEEIISIDAGTNWRDKYNFAEIRPSLQDAPEQNTYLKNKAQLADLNAFSREGFRPYMTTIKQYAINATGNIDIASTGSWKYLLREWYFDTHRMLNGAITFMGQADHIEVGSNLVVDIGILGPSVNLTQAAAVATKNPSLLLHVESVSHTFSVGEDGARNFITTVQFVRGIVIDTNGNPLGAYGRLDNSVDSLTAAQKINNEVVSVSTSNDPDLQRGS